MEYPFIAIAPRSTLTHSGNTWYGPIYESNKTNYVCKQKTNLESGLLYNNTWNHLTVCKKELRLV